MRTAAISAVGAVAGLCVFMLLPPHSRAKLRPPLPPLRASPDASRPPPAAAAASPPPLRAAPQPQPPTHPPPPQPSPQTSSPPPQHPPQAAAGGGDAPVCPRLPCAQRMSVLCAIGAGAKGMSRWLPENPRRLAVNGTLFISTFRPSPTATLLHEFWYNMLYHFERAVVGGSMLLGAAKCPLPSSSVVESLHVNGTTYSRPVTPLKPVTAVCHPLPHPCDCPGPLLHARCKFALILAVVSSGMSAFWIDSDAVLLRNPFTALPSVPVGNGMPGLRPKRDLAGCFEKNYHINLGVLWIAPSEGSVAAFRVATESMHMDRQIDAAGAHPWLVEQVYVAQLYFLEQGMRHKYPRLPFAPVQGPLSKKMPHLGAAEAWDGVQNACRAQNKRLLAWWRDAAMEGRVTTLHASGGCTSHVWGKKGFMIELRAWYSAADARVFFAQPKPWNKLRKWQWG
eukprot:TRINITY_DN40456_c0_g1_i1.p1 TRINITY_DN40456_c0_g1~~TRINITY_DN40456_c0_g1_i1.p1  ORF type:complete len:473 (+),score=154.63 TRINITY_DN40456_c0_g1_i1:65-1420(+)